MQQNEQIIERFYSCFQARDSMGMASCYHPDIVFSDPVFGQLKGIEALDMWKMLCSRATDLKITYDNIKADETTGSAHWEAQYKFTRTGRPVHNVIEASFVFREGRIIRHTDTFNLWRWTCMALGL